MQLTSLVTIRAITEIIIQNRFIAFIPIHHHGNVVANAAAGGIDAGSIKELCNQHGLFIGEAAVHEQGIIQEQPDLRALCIRGNRSGKAADA